MGRWWRSREKESETEEEDGENKAVIILTSDDEEANEDLSLAVIAKARLREAKRKKDKEKDGEIFIDLSTSEIDAVTNGKIAGGREGFVRGTKVEAKKKRKSRAKKSSKKEVDEVIAQGQDCFICKRRGHHAKECPDKHKITSEESIICLRCGDLGHDMAFCKKDYAYSDMKEIQCYVCKKFGHLCCVDYKDNGPIEISCYNCAEIGHTGQGCAKHTCESIAATPPTLCFRCGKEGHFARGCTKELKSFKRLGESSTPVNRLKVKKDFKVSKSLPRDFGIEHKKKRSYLDKSMRHVKSKIKGGWIVDDELGYKPKWRHEAKDWASPTTPSGRTNKFHSAFSDRRYSGYSSYSSPRTPHQRYNFHAGTPIMRSSTGGYHHGFSARRFGYSDGFYD